MVRRHAFAGRHAPLLGGCLHEHQPRGGAGVAHVHEEMPGRARTIRVLVAVFRLVAFGLLDADLGPVRLEFVGDDDAPAGPYTLPHVGAVTGDGDDAVFTDRDEDLGVVDPAVRHAVGPEAGRARASPGGQRDREDEPAAHGEDAPAAHVEDERGRRQVGGARLALEGLIVCHQIAPFFWPAAWWMAARMRG